jgi:hypothetical protein
MAAPDRIKQGPPGLEKTLIIAFPPPGVGSEEKENYYSGKAW